MIVLIPDTAPLIHLAAGGLLDVMPALGRVVVPDVIALEATRYRAKPFASEVAAWLELGAVEIAETDWGPIYRMAADQGLKTPRNAGDTAILGWLHVHLTHDIDEAFVIYEDKRVPGILLGEGGLEDIVLLTTQFACFGRGERHNPLCRSRLGKGGRASANSQPGLHPNHEATAMNSSTTAIHPALLRYSKGEISAGHAASLLGPDSTIHDVIYQMRELGLEPPQAPGTFEEAQLAKARRILSRQP